jgi:hypothetical protein
MLSERSNSQPMTNNISPIANASPYQVAEARMTVVRIVPPIVPLQLLRHCHPMRQSHSANISEITFKIKVRVALTGQLFGVIIFPIYR